MEQEPLDEYEAPAIEDRHSVRAPLLGMTSNPW
jgi:hypothetical protein